MMILLDFLKDISSPKITAQRTSEKTPYVYPVLDPPAGLVGVLEWSARTIAHGGQ